MHTQLRNSLLKLVTVYKVFLVTIKQLDFYLNTIFVFTEEIPFKV